MMEIRETRPFHPPIENNPKDEVKKEEKEKVQKEKMSEDPHKMPFHPPIEDKFTPSEKNKL